MMSGYAIAALAREVAIQAAAYEREPYHPISVDEVETWRSFPIPQLGAYRPEGWCLVETVRVSKLGADGRSIGLEGFKKWCAERLAKDETAGFGWVEEGQFQIYAGYFTEEGSPASEGLEPDQHEEYDITWCECCDTPYETGEGCPNGCDDEDEDWPEYDEDEDLEDE